MGVTINGTELDPESRLVDRAAITDLIIRRGRAADAKDTGAIVASHVPGSRDSHGFFEGTIEEFAAYLDEQHYSRPLYGLQRHAVAGLIIDYDDADHARVESTHIAYHRINDPERGPWDVLIGGRYLDEVERHAGRWLLLSRTLVYDWTRARPATDPTRHEETR